MKRRKLLVVILSLCLLISTTAGMTTVAGADEHVHNLTYYPYEASTCCTIGNIEFWYCADCNSRYTDAAATNKVIAYDLALPLDPDNHEDTPVILFYETEPTCTDEGVAYYIYYCCGTECSATVAATGHNYVDHVCTVCGELDCIAFASGWIVANDGTLTILSDDGMYDWTENGYRTVYGNQVTSAVVESGVTFLRDYAFLYCTNMTSITIPDTVTSIGKYTFYGCPSLESVTIPDSVTSIDDYAFEYCSKLISITIPESVESIGKSAFYGCTGLGTVTIESCATTIGENAFYNTPALANGNISQPSHTYDSVVTTEATCTEDGVMTYTCTVCGDSYTEAIAATGHTMTHVEAKEATCTVEGNIEYWYCSACEKYFSDESGNTEISLSDTVIAATGHTVVTDEAVAATCTEAGLTEGSHCSVCGEVLVAQEVVPATGHAWGETAYTWSEDGSSCTATRTCTNDSSHVEEATATITSEQTLAPTCTEKGETTYTATFSEDWAETQTLTVADVDATGHTYEAVVTDPTCTEQGYTTYTCTEGDDSYVDDYTEAIGHNYGEPVWAWDTNGGATATFTCTNDSSHVEVVTATITATGNLGAVTKVATVTFNGETYSISQTSGTSLQSLAADYTAVREAIAKANALNASDYTNFANVTSAINAVNWNLNMLSQSTVNGYAEAIETAIKNLVSVNLTEETVNIEEPVEDTDTDTEEEEMEVSDPEPETESNPTTGFALAMLPMAIALATNVAGKRR